MAEVSVHFWCISGPGLKTPSTRTPFLAKDDWPMNINDINENPEGKPSQQLEAAYFYGFFYGFFTFVVPMGPIEWDDPADFRMLKTAHCFIGRNGMIMRKLNSLCDLENE